MLVGKPAEKPLTIGASVRLPIPLMATITAMAERANVSRNQIFVQVLEAAVEEVTETLAKNYPEDLAKIQENAHAMAEAWFEQYDETFDEE